MSIDLIHPNLKLLSPSSSVVLHRCARRFEIDKLTGNREEETIDTRFGHVVGAGVQTSFITGSRDQSYLSAMLRWHDDLDDDDAVRAKKTFWHSLLALDKFQALRSSYFRDFELVYFQGKPAIELGFSIDCGDGFFYRGFLDALLVSTSTRALVVYEGKTTKFKNIDEASYKHSNQALGYSTVIDTISSQLNYPLSDKYQIRYAVWKTAAAEWETMEFTKSHTQRALWIKNILIDKGHIIEYALDDYFPMHGESCYDFFRQCPHFGTCELQNKYLIGTNIPVRVEPEDKYQFKYRLEDIIEAQLKGMET